MVRALWALVHLHALSTLFSPTSEPKRLNRGHRAVVLNTALRQLVSEDSGYWDYALLMFYDEAVRALVLSGLSSLSDFGWAERTALLASWGLDVNATQPLLHMCQNVAGFFVMLGRNFILVCILSALAVVSHGWAFVAADLLLTLAGDALLTRDDLRHHFFLVADPSLL